MGKPHDVMKEGWNHRIQGTATDIQNQALIAIDRRWPNEAVLAYQSHDSGTISFPIGVTWWPEIRPSCGTPSSWAPIFLATSGSTFLAGPTA